MTMVTSAVVGSWLDERQRRLTVASDQANWNRGRHTSMPKGDQRNSQPTVHDSNKKATSINSQHESEISELFKAARAGNASKVEKLLEQGEDPNWFNKKSGQTVFISALYGALSKLNRNIKPKNLRKFLDQYDVVLERLLDAGARVNEADAEQRTPLLLVASEKAGGNHSWIVELSQLFLSKGANVDATDRDGRTSLMCAATHGNVNLADLLIEKRADVNAMDCYGRTPLMHATTNGNVSLTKLLLEAEANVEASDHNGRTPLMCASIHGSVELVELLLHHGADIHAWNVRGRTALHMAAENNQEGVAKLLLDRGANPSAISDGGWTPLHNAAQNGHESIVRLLLENERVDPNSQLHSGMTALHWAAFKGWDSVIQLLLAAKPAVNIGVKDSTRRTPMLYAAANGFIHLAKKLSPAHAADRLSETAKKACEEFEATVVDFKPSARRQYVYKYSIYELLYAWDNEGDKPKVATLTENVRSRPEFRWIHLPANNIAWAEALLAKRYEEGGYKELGELMALEKCFDQEHRGRFAHSHFMRPFCQRIVTSQPENPDEKPDAKMVIFMPFLHYETHEAREIMSNTIKGLRKGRSLSNSHSRDSLLVHAYMESTPSLQPRRTLDQYFYDDIDTTSRDTDQVVYRFCENHQLEKKVFMVDQLWLWVLGKDLVVTCFPERWNQPKQDPLNVLDGIIEDINAKTRSSISSVHDLALLIISRCSGAFDRHRVNDQDYQFLEMFSSSIGFIADKESQLFNSFDEASRKTWQWLKGDHLERSQSAKDQPQSAKDDPNYDVDRFQDELLNISKETSLLTETKDIKDELRIIDVILDSQLSVLENFEAPLKKEGSSKHQSTLAIANEVRKSLETHRKDIKRMDEQASSLYVSLTQLLDLKQKHCNAIEARFAGKQAAITAKQAKVTAKQGQMVLVFTIVTVIFLPMSFIATFFSIDIAQWNGGLTIGYVSKYMFGIGLGISIMLIAMAFTSSEINEAGKRVVSAIKGRLLRSRQGIDDESLGESSLERERAIMSSSGRSTIHRRLNPYTSRHIGEDLERDGADRIFR